MWIPAQAGGRQELMNSTWRRLFALLEFKLAGNCGLLKNPSSTVKTRGKRCFSCECCCEMEGMTEEESVRLHYSFPLESQLCLRECVSNSEEQCVQLSLGSLESLINVSTREQWETSRLVICRQTMVLTKQENTGGDSRIWLLARAVLAWLGDPSERLSPFFFFNGVRVEVDEKSSVGVDCVTNSVLGLETKVPERHLWFWCPCTVLPHKDLRH